MKQVKYRIGRWLPSDKKFLSQWIAQKIEHSTRMNLPLRQSVQELRDAIYADPILYMGFTSMYDQIPQGYNEPIKNFENMLMLINQILNEAPCFSVYENKVGLVGFPINAILDWAMGTQGGYLTFLHPVVNQKLEVILNEWKQFLSSEDSCYVLTDGPIVQPQPDYSNPVGWFSPEALEAMADMDPMRGITSPEDPLENFKYNFKYEPDQPYFGYTSWDDFFTREFKLNARTISTEDSGIDVIVNACESAPYNCVNDANRKDNFWMKGQPYSLLDIMDHHPLADEFGDGSTVYQAFFMCQNLSPME